MKAYKAYYWERHVKHWKKINRIFTEEEVFQNSFPVISIKTSVKDPNIIYVKKREFGKIETFKFIKLEDIDDIL